MFDLVLIAGNDRTRVLHAAVELEERRGLLTALDIERETRLSPSAVRVHLRCLDAHHLVAWDRAGGTVVPLVRRVKEAA